MHIAGVECVRDSEGGLWVYDINCNTNYNEAAEAIAGVVPGARRVATYLSIELEKDKSA